jgi:hypothetical protein
MEAHRQTESTKSAPTFTRPQTPALPLPLVGLVVVAAVAFGVVLFFRGHGSAKLTLPPVGVPAAVSEAQLKALAEATDHPIYWAGPKQATYELTRTTDGRIYVRYLPSVAELGNRSPRYLTIGTYPTKRAYQAIERAGARQGGVAVKLDRGGLLVFNQSTPKSVYFGYPKTGYQVEVFDPSPMQARALVLRGSISPIH